MNNLIFSLSLEQKTAQDFLEPVDFHVYYGIHEYPFEENPRGDNPIKFPGGLPPIIDENICGNGTHIDEVCSMKKKTYMYTFF